MARKEKLSYGQDTAGPECPDACGRCRPSVNCCVSVVCRKTSADNICGNESEKKSHLYASGDLECATGIPSRSYQWRRSRQSQNQSSFCHTERTSRQQCAQTQTGRKGLSFQGNLLAQMEDWRLLASRTRQANWRPPKAIHCVCINRRGSSKTLRSISETPLWSIRQTQLSIGGS